jgi:hypothetical protein
MIFITFLFYKKDEKHKIDRFKDEKPLRLSKQFQKHPINILN